MSDKGGFVAAQGQLENGMPAIYMVSREAERQRAPGKFVWHLSILVAVKEGEETEHGLPSNEENKVLGEVGDAFDDNIVTSGNAIWLARNTFDNLRQYIYRVTDPEIPHKYLQDVIATKTQLRDFDYRMDNDPDWELAEQYLGIARSQPDVEADNLDDLKLKLD